jgi:hypothetical protein
LEATAKAESATKREAKETKNRIVEDYLKPGWYVNICQEYRSICMGTGGEPRLHQYQCCGGTLVENLAVESVASDNGLNNKEGEGEVEGARRPQAF